MASIVPASGSSSGLFAGINRRDLIMPFVLVGILGLMIVPLPTIAIDLLLTVNITMALLLLLTGVNVKRPLDISVFPSLLLVTTLFRLSLNVSTTRLILLHGQDGTGAAGDIVEVFGSFVVGGSYVVGIVVFLVLTLINFVVITRGSGRIAEVSARFTLDALPGKQMSIDSDLAAGLIDQDEARTRRTEVSRETDFHGAMDGASKFVRGDAIAGLVITAINIIGGLVIGVAQQDMTLAEAAQTYTVLTIGDGLVSQIPALLISTASGIIVTRTADAGDLGAQILKQVFMDPRVLMASAFILVALSAVPGMPFLMFVMLAAGLVWMARNVDKLKEDLATETEEQEGAAAGPQPGPDDPESIESVLPVETLELEVGYGLLPLVDAREGGEVVGRIERLRRNFAREMGIILPPVHIKDNLELAPSEYRLLIHGVEAAKGSVMPDRLLAMDPGDVRDPVPGVETVEPAFGLPALWVRAADKARAELSGYTVVEPAAVIITHLSEILQRDCEQLIGREELQQLLDVVARRRPRIVDELIPNVLTHAHVLAVMRSLLAERVSVRDMPSILEALADASRYGKAVPFLVDQVRERMGGAVVQALLGPDSQLHVAMLDAATEDTLRPFVVRNEADVNLAPDLSTAQSLLAQLQSAVSRLHDLGYPAVIIAPTDLRYPLWRFATRFISQVHVLGQNELPPRVKVSTEFTVSTARRATRRGPATMAPGTRPGGN
jgi:flagellar biosynthesis protein FlhA